MVKEGIKERLSVGGVVGWGRGALIVKSPMGISTVAVPLEDRWDQFHCFQPKVVAAVAGPEDTPDSAAAAAG